MFVVMQLGLAVAAELSFRVRDPAYADKEAKLARLGAARGGPQVVMLGSSRTGFGFHGFHVEEQLAAEFPGAVAFNFGAPAAGPVTSALYLRRLVEHGHRPDLLLVEVLPPLLAEVPEGPLEVRFLSGNRLRGGEVERAVGYGFWAELVRGKWRSSVTVPWSALRLPILGRLSPSSLLWVYRQDWGRTCDGRGWGGPDADVAPPGLYSTGLERARREYAGFLADLQPAAGGAARALADLLALCREQGIPVKLVLMPESEDFRAFYPPATLARLDEFLRGLCAAHGCELIDAREWVPTIEFTDGHHLLRSGAKRFSGRLARDVIAPAWRERK